MRCWVTRDGQQIPIGSMDSGHLVNVLRILKKQASCSWRVACHKVLAQCDPDLLRKQVGETWRDYVHELFWDLDAEARRRELDWDLWDGGPALNAEGTDIIDLSRRGQLERKVVGAIRDAIFSHGALTRTTAPSAAKRVIGAIKDYNKGTRACASSAQQKDCQREANKRLAMSQTYRLIPTPTLKGEQDLLVEPSDRCYRIVDRASGETVASGLLLEEVEIVQAAELRVMLSTLMQAVAQYYSEDETTAGLVMAWLPDRASYYVSVCRYRGAFGAGKQVIACTTANTVEEAINQVTPIWLKNIGKSRSLEELINELSSDTKQS